MRPRALVIAGAVILCTLQPGTTVQLSGQAPPYGCLAPFPEPPLHRLPFGNPEKAGEHPEAAGGLFVSANGDLCRTLELEGSGTLPWQGGGNPTPRPGRAALLSAMVPGAGQWFLGQGRWPAYVAVELWAWIQLLDWRREGHHLQSQYKDLAWYVARRVSTGLRTDAGWEYYEALTQFQSSGAFDSDPLSPGVQPEDDPSTFNGSIWALAQEIYIPEDPENPVGEGSEAYERASAYYISRAYASTLAWDWGINALHQNEYTTLIRESDEALRSSTGMIGIILANHLLSAADALVSGRLGIAGRAEPSVEVMFAPGPFNNRQVALHFRLPNPLAHVR